MNTGRPSRYQHKSGVRHGSYQPERQADKLLLAALRVWEAKQDMSGQPRSIWAKRKVEG